MHDPWMAAMRRGDFAAAWAASDAALARRQPGDFLRADQPRHLQCVWDGRPLAGKRVLVHCYHGLGDTLQFVRLLPLLRRQASEVVLWAQPALHGLLRGLPGIDRLEPLHEDAPAIDRDADIELMELPHLLRLSPWHIPARVPYLAVPPRSRAPRRAGWPRVGLAWQSGDWDAARSIPPAALQPLARGLPLRWASVQYGADALPFPMEDLACRDLVQQAERLLALDLVVTVDTLTAHLAGALGLPVWTLLPTPCDWRWMEARRDTPWYPTMRLFRQHRTGDWGGVVAELREALLQWAARRALRTSGSAAAPGRAAAG
jgi:hypothetical protein